MENMYQDERTATAEQSNGGRSSKRRGSSRETRKGDNKLVVMAVAFLAAIVVFIVMVSVESHLINSEETKYVIVATAPAPKGMVLTEENMPNYFTMAERPITELPANAYDSGNPLKGKVLSRDIAVNEVLTPACVYEEDFYADVEDPVEISIELSKIGQAVGGILRPGDLIDIKVVVEVPQEEGELTEGIEEGYQLSDVPEITITDELNVDVTGTITDTEGGDLTALYTPDLTQQDIDSMTGAVDYSALGGTGQMQMEGLLHSITGNYVCAPVAENIRVTNVFNSAGQDSFEAEAAGTTHVATVINVVIPRSLQDVIYLAMEEGTLRLSRVASTDEEDVEEETTEDVAGEVTETVEATETVEEVVSTDAPVEDTASVESVVDDTVVSEEQATTEVTEGAEVTE